MSDQAVTIWGVLWRGVRGVCPSCGEGKLFRGYITQNEVCSVCDEDLSGIRADDAPPWLTIVIAAHISLPFIHYFGTREVFSPVIDIGIVVAVVLLCAAFILPRAKGLFIAELWRQSKL